MKFKLIASVLVLAVALTGVIGATSAYFSDYSTSKGNTFSSGSLDLKVATGASSTNFNDGNFTLIQGYRMTPNDDVIIDPNHQQPRGIVKVKNTGTVDGWLSITNVRILNEENNHLEPEKLFGDQTSDIGELGGLVSISIFLDKFKGGTSPVAGTDGSYTSGDVKIFEGKINDLGNPASTAWKLSPTDFLALESDGEVDVVAIITNWWSGGAADNTAQDDSVTVDLTFTLNQYKRNSAGTNQNPEVSNSVVYG